MSIDKIIKDISDAEQEIEQHVKDKRVAVFIGRLKAGKSTIISHIMRDQIVSKEDDAGQLGFIKVPGSRANGPTIGGGSSACTTTPKPYTPPIHGNSNDFVLCDMPGLDDNRGEAQDIINAFAIRKVVAVAKEIKFVFVCDINTLLITDITLFLRLMEAAVTMIPNILNHQY